MDEDKDRKQLLRHCVLSKMWAWHGKPAWSKSSIQQLYALFGYADYNALANAHNDGDETLQASMEALDGPHGYAVYKMLLARKV